MKNTLLLVLAGLTMGLGACGDDSAGSNTTPICDPTCDANAGCEDVEGVATCVCNDGYTGDGATCADVDECADGTATCDTNATCANTDGSYTCTCLAGYQGDGMSCYDIDECTTSGHNCDANATCTNTVGGFTCACNSPYVGDGTACVEATDCTSDPSICAADATCTSQGAISVCLCNAGYAGDGLTCSDVDECTDSTHTCHADASCTNTTGSFTCACDAGFTGDGTTCTDTDECTDGTHNCDADATCANTPGGFDCSCDAGYAGTGDVCFDIDECLEGLDNCDVNANCTNLLGSFSCACHQGTIDDNGDGTACSYYATCYDILVNVGAGLPDGQYTIDPDGMGVGLDPFVVYCDMSTTGGGWTIVYAATGADGEEPMVSDTAVAGDAFTAHFNLNRAQKMAVAALSGTSIFVRPGGQWIKADHALLDGTLDDIDSEAHYPVILRAGDGSSATGEMGWSNFNIGGGGDFHVSTGPVDHHSVNYWTLNSGCANQYLYSYSNVNQDGDAGYDVNTALGSWTTTVTCESSEGGQLAFYAAMRPLVSLELDIGPQVGTYSYPRGYYFTAPVDIIITGIRVPEDASTAPQTMQLIRFVGGAPTALTSSYTTEAYVTGLAGNVWHPVSIVVTAGEVIGIMGTRGGISSYGATAFSSSIDGIPVTLNRLWYEGVNFETTGAEYVAPEDYYIARIEMQYTSF